MAEGCYHCHTQMIRSLRDEVERYGIQSARRDRLRPSLPMGVAAHRPRSRRLGGKYSDEWHVAHMIDPRAVVPKWVMPGYSFLARRELDHGDIGQRL